LTFLFGYQKPMPLCRKFFGLPSELLRIWFKYQPNEYVAWAALLVDFSSKLNCASK
jgi:hypothetical protein